MKTTTGLKVLSARLLAGSAAAAMITTGALAQSIGDEIVVTAQRKEQNLQDVPIAVSAFGGQDLQDRQLESFTDLQFNIPNFSFSRTQFTSSTISLRGIGQLAVGSSTEDNVSVHVNEVFIAAPRLFETEFFDVERIEILRGPQGTLYGRNATGGVINVVTAKANPDAIEGYADAEYGNFNSVKFQGALNVPLTEALAVRLAGTTIQRDGFTENLFDGQDIDDRNINSIRGSVRWLPTDNTTIDITASYLVEDDNRARSQKQACADGPLKPFLGCQPGVERDFTSAVDLRATFAANASAEALGLIAGDPAAAAFGLYSLANPVEGQAQPSDLRQVNQDFTPQYDAEETYVVINAKHDFENWSVKLNAGAGNSKIATRNDFDGGVGPDLAVPAAIATLPGVANYLANGFPLSDFDLGIEGPNNGLVGSIGGFTQSTSNNFQAVDLSIGERDYVSLEGIVQTDFDSRFNFLAGVNYLESNGFADYAVAQTGLDYFSVVAGTLSTQAAQATAAADAAAAATLGAGGSATDAQIAAGQAAAAAAAAVGQTGFAFFTPYFFNDSDDNSLESISFFGEVYVDISDTLKFTGGIRHNRDTKAVRDRGNLLDTFVASATGTLPAGAVPVVPLGTQSVRGLLDPNEAVQGDALAINDFRVVEGDFNATTGRAVLQWTPTDNAQFYASWTRGFKPGGFNPQSNIQAVAPVYDQEIINSYEVGVKSSLLDGMLQANLTGFYYDYSGLQVSRIIGTTSFNENIDATIFGIESEFVLQPDDHWTLNMNASYLNTDIGEFAAVDVRNPTAGQPGVDLIADVAFGLNCAIDNQGAPSLIGQDLGDPGLTGLFASPFSSCASIGGALPLINAANGGLTNYTLLDPGVEVSVEGNELPGASNFQIGGGVQYEARLGNGWLVTPRIDAYYQTEFYSNIFNTEADRIDGYAYLNGQIRFEPEDGNWYIRAFVQNITDNDAITGQFDVGSNAGNFTNVFLLEPRRWGFGVGVRF